MFVVLTGDRTFLKKMRAELKRFVVHH